MSLYKDPVLQKLIERLNASGPARLRNKYFVGDPIILPPKSQLPIVYISRDTTTISIDSTMDDRHVMPVVLNVVYNATAEINQGEWSKSGTLALYELCEGRNDDYTLRADSIAGVLRNSQVLDGNGRLWLDIEGAETSIEYVVSPPQRRGEYSIEAIIRTRIVNLQLRA